MTGTKLRDVGWRCLQSVDGDKREKEKEKEKGRDRRRGQREKKGGLKSIRNSKTLRIHQWKKGIWRSLWPTEGPPFLGSSFRHTPIGS